MIQDMTPERQSEVKDRIARVLSEILSDKYGCKVTLTFVPKDQKG